MKALIPLADGVEEMEAVIIADVLRRAGWTVTLAGLKPGPVTAARGVRLLPDDEWNRLRLDDFEALILPGGAVGSRHLCEHEGVQVAIRAFAASGRLLAAICAAPLALQAAGVLRNRRATCHPAVRAQLTQAKVEDARVVEDGTVVTGAGPGAAFEFALVLVARINGRARADALAAEMLVH